MATLRFPYGKGYIEYTFAAERFSAELTSKLHHYQAALSGEELVRQSLENPIGTPKLRVMAEEKQKVVIIASDHTRPVPSKIIMPQLLAEIRKGNPQADITILISTGCHRDSTREELIAKFGSEIVATEKIVIHNCDLSEFVYCGKLPSGGDIYLNRIAVEADLLIAEGFIEPHFFAGFSGGRKSVLPGIANRQTVIYNHNAEFINHPCARTGMVEDNPIHNDMLYACRVVNLGFICNVVINSAKEVVYAVAGDCELAHRVGRDFLSSKCQVKAIPSDIVVVTNGGYPLDQNIYQAVKGMTAAEVTVKKGGVIIMLAKSEDGHGGEEFYQTFAKEKDVARMLQTFLNTPKEKTRIDQWQSQIFARVLLHARVIYVSDATPDMVRALHMTPANSIAEALEIAETVLQNPNAGIVAIPDGVGTIIV